MNKITESAIEKFAIELLEKSGFQYIYAPSIAPDSETPERASFADVLLLERLQTAVGRINPSIPADIREDAIKQIQRLGSPELIANNEAFHRLLTEGVNVSFQKKGVSRGDLVWLIDFNNPEDNDFLVANQFTVIENNVIKRPDIILFVNGLPLVLIELKNPVDENATIKSAFRQLQTYKQAIPGLFTFNCLMIISDGLEAKAGAISAGFTRFMAWKTADGKDRNGLVIGKKVVYGFAKYMRDALPNATYLGFTGTPIENTDINTPAVFGNYVDIYDILQAVEDGATVRIFYESRLAKINLSEEGRQLVSDLDDELDFAGAGFESAHGESQNAKTKWTRLEALVGSMDRIKQVARDIARYHTTKDQRRMLADRMKDPEDELKLVIVRDMWLTGFDVPSMHTLYIDKPMKGHTLMQAIARVNRVYKDKPGGLVVDYLGLASDLKKALSFYSDSGGKGDPAILQEKAVQMMLEKVEVISQMFHGVAYEDYFEADTGKKLSLILAAEEHILGLENGRIRYVREVTSLSRAFAIAIPHEQAMDVKDEVAFFQAVKSRLAKFDGTGAGGTDEDIETAIRQVIDKALVTEQVIDVFDAAGIKKPDISILSEEFLLEVKNMVHKNIAMEVLKKLLNDEIRARIKKNLIQGKSLMEMLENSIKRYHNKIITAAEVIEELIALGKDIQQMDKEPREMGLSEIEYAFYTAIANNDSAREVMGKDKLRELAVVLYEKVKENASIDWTIKESVKAKLKVIVKRTLRQYGYPPDMQKLATETVLKQAEMIAEEITHGK
ncbi:MAG: type I restriction enzyme endonuclease domain-containing protein [Pseudomonadota bacterium]